MEINDLPKVLSQREVEMFFKDYPRNNYEDCFYYYIFKIIMYSGIREIECLKIKLEDIDWERRCIWIWETKNKQPYPAIPHPELLEELKTWISYVKDKYPNTPYLFPTFTKLVTNQVYIIRKFRQRLKEIGIPRIYTPYCLRHSFATHLVEKGVPIETISRLLNHKSIDMTRRYTFCAVENFISEVAKLKVYS